MAKPRKGKRPIKIALDLSARLTEALREHQAGDVAGAMAKYEEMLEFAPDQPTLRHFLGMGQIQLKRFAEGEANVKRALQADPDYADAWNSLGNLYRLTGRPEEALEAYQAVTRLAPRIIAAWVNLGDLYRNMGNPVAARDALKEAVAISGDGREYPAPLRAQMLQSLAALERLWGHWDESARLYKAALELRPQDAQCRRDLIRVLMRAERRDEALALASAWLEREPDHPLAQRIHASLTDVNTPERAPAEEVVNLFDGIAGIFDEQLAELNYRAPALLQDAVERRLGPPGGRLPTCDAGCGTGLCGPWLRAYAATLDGVDLSQGMLDLAARRNVYDRLEKSELTAWLAGRHDAFGLVVSADVLCYFGDLSGFATAAHGALQPAGLLAFTVEYEAEPRQHGYHIQINGRYTHNEPYVHGCLAAAGFTDIVTDHAHLRLEGGQPVHGLVVTARRP